GQALPAVRAAQAAGPAAGRPAAAARGHEGAAPPPRARGRSNRSARGIPSHSLQVFAEQIGQPCQRGARARLDRAQWNTKVLGHLTLREAAPVRERDHLVLPLRELLERAVDAPGDPILLGALGRAGAVARRLRYLGRRVDTGARAVDDRVSGDRVEPWRPGPALRLVRGGGAPDRRERLLHGVLRASAVAEPAQRQPEHGPRVAAVERL